MSSAAAMVRRETLRRSPKLADETAVAECPDWHKLYESMRVSVRGKVRRMLDSRGGVKDRDHEDVCQEIWGHVWKSGPNYWNPRGVNLIAKQICLKWMSRDQLSHLGVPLEITVGGFQSNEGSGLVGAANKQERDLGWREPFDEMSHLCPDVSKIAAKLLLLPGEQRAVFSFRYALGGHEELTFREIGERLGMTTSATAHTFYQAVRNLKTLLGE